MANTFLRGSGRISIQADVHDLYKSLSADGKGIELAPFETMKDVFMAAACLGFKLGKRRTLVGKREQPIQFSVFKDQTDIPILKAIALATSHDVNTLVDHEKMVEIAEEYANAGIGELRLRLAEDQSQDPLWLLVDMIRTN